MKKIKILFQGDSITDAGRDRGDIHNLGNGYPKYASQLLTERHPEIEFEFVNQGISGNKVSDLIARLQTDFVDIGADIVSVLIGVNDTWHNAEEKTWIDNKVFEADLRKIYSTIKNEMGAKLIVMEPFTVPYEWLEIFYEDLDPKRRIIRALAREYADVYIPVDGLLAAAYLGRELQEFSGDGVHPAEGGAKAIAQWYVEAVEKLL